ncbi:E3 SUMO-protein ligase ZBED1-like isoform X2 [Epinephelus lanceolatus]|uniref:zinc finger BED domain-containing protein 1-like isoform X2 n=1 Tax=Epinephelus lanceolatus TaxID=310571 RepID=UPI001446D964|nr:zinc finger BED domain-containing protein 1-like isoform X2 [Epinephelus lanceolatus]
MLQQHKEQRKTENAVKGEADCTNRAIGICRKLVGHFSHSWRKREALREAQRELNLPQHAMVTDCQTRWGSTQKMIARVLEQQHALTKVLSTDRKTRQRLPSLQDLDVLESLNKALSPLQDFTDALSAEQYVSISYLKPVLHLLNTSVLAEEAENSDLTKSLKAKILSYLNEKYQATQDLLNITTFLDPRFRTKYASTEETKTTKERVISEVMAIQHQPEAQRTIAMEEDSLDVDNPPAAKAKKKTLASFFQNSPHTPTTASVSSTTFDPMAQCSEAVASELTTYTYMLCVGHEEDPLK